MRGITVCILACLLLSAVSVQGQGFLGPGFGFPGYYPGYYPGFGGPFGGGPFGGGPFGGDGRGLAFLGSAALLAQGNPLGRLVGGVGLLSLL